MHRNDQTPVNGKQKIMQAIDDIQTNMNFNVPGTETRNTSHHNCQGKHSRTSESFHKELTWRFIHQSSSIKYRWQTKKVKGLCGAPIPGVPRALVGDTPVHGAVSRGGTWPGRGARGSSCCARDAGLPKTGLGIHAPLGGGIRGGDLSSDLSGSFSTTPTASPLLREELHGFLLAVGELDLAAFGGSSFPASPDVVQ